MLALAWGMSIGENGRVYLPGIPVALPELCTLKRLWGLACPGCGLTRCFIALAGGNLQIAWSYNPAGVWLFAIMAFQLPYRILQLTRLKRQQPELSLGYAPQAALALFALALIGQWLLQVYGLKM